MEAVHACRPYFSLIRVDGRAPAPWCADLAAILAGPDLYAVFQPIVDFADARIVGYEGLIRGPSDSALHSPLNLFAAAEQCQQLLALELRLPASHPAPLCRVACKGAVSEHQPASAARPGLSPRRNVGWMRAAGLSPEQVVIEADRNPAGGRTALLRKPPRIIGTWGFALRWDDLGEGFPICALWSAAPDYVKLDKYFTQGIASDAAKQQFVRSVQAIAHATGARVIAEASKPPTTWPA